VLGLFSSSISAAALSAMLDPIGVRSAESVVTTTVVYFVFTSIAAVIFGLPGFLALNKFGLVRWWSLTAYGALVGLISLVVFLSDKIGNGKSLWALTTVGGVAGFIFWVVWRTGKSDKKT
jgi:hypothetical protein